MQDYVTKARVNCSYYEITVLLYLQAQAFLLQYIGVYLTYNREKYMSNFTGANPCEDEERLLSKNLSK